MTRRLPLPSEMIEETLWVRSRVHIPIIADEACQRAANIPKPKDAFDGVNVQLDHRGTVSGFACGRAGGKPKRTRWYPTGY